MLNIRTHWRAWLARLPLPTLALAASYGVYSFQVLFTPWWVAVISAASFELVYIGLAVARLDERDRQRAARISLGAVAVSIVYNSLSALAAIRPGLLSDRPLWADIALAVAHGLPLAVVAYLVADLLLHADGGQGERVEPPIEAASPARLAADPLAARKAEAARLRAEGASWATIGRAVERSPATVREWLTANRNGHGG